jgi:hypothetical protein
VKILAKNFLVRECEPVTLSESITDLEMNTTVEQVEALHYKLHMMGVPIYGPASIYCDTQSVFKNVSQPESACNKKTQFDHLALHM